jgi:hypothetical protein
MRVIVYRLRKEGRRLQESRWCNDPVGPGDLHMHNMLAGSEAYQVIELWRPGKVKDQYLLPALFEPRLVTIGNSRFLFRGFERTGSGGATRGTVQEWLCEVVAAPP